MAVAAVPRDEGVVGEDVDGGPGALGGAEHAGGVGGAAPAAEVADELGAEVDVGGLPVAGGGALDEARGTGEVLAGNEAAEVGAGGVGGVGRLGPRGGSGGGGEVVGLGVGEVGVREGERRLEERGHGGDWRPSGGGRVVCVAPSVLGEPHGGIGRDRIRRVTVGSLPGQLGMPAY